MATYFIALTGNDTTGTGTQVNPWRTTTKGIAALNPGDTLYIRGGSWANTSLTGMVNKGGTSEATRITVAGFPGETPIIMPAAASSGGGCRVIVVASGSGSNYIT